ncbi:MULTISPECIES: hypothetical protein [Geobacillus]|nr:MULTISPECIES: hypothetical protein [Geobacillus]
MDRNGLVWRRRGASLDTTVRLRRQGVALTTSTRRRKWCVKR